jgi:Cft2 family RNA processing exonuclease
MAKPAGAARFAAEALAYVHRAQQLGHVAEACPSVGTRREQFAPVLVERLLRDYPTIHARMLETHPRLAVAAALGAVIEQIEAGYITDHQALRRACAAGPGGGARGPAQHVLFDLMYGALQLLAFAPAGDPKADELFNLVTTMVYAAGTGGRGGGGEFPLHVEHFLAHAAVFMSARTEEDRWRDVVQRATIAMEQWGAPPAAEAVFTHCAHNLGLVCSGMPASDLHYDLVKHLRRRAANNDLAQANAFEALSLAFGWQTASPVVRLLWARAYPEYCDHEAGVAAAHDGNTQASVDCARSRGYTSPLGIPFVRTTTPLTSAGQFAVSFPGGWAIGKTSVLCKAGPLRLLLDCGADQVGRLPWFAPDLGLVDGVLISHAHNDHIGGLLALYGRYRYDGRWYAPEAMAPIAERVLRDAARLQQDEGRGGARGADALVSRLMNRFVGVPVGATLELAQNVRVRPLPAGHVPASCQWLVTHGGKHLLYTGDFNTRSSLSVAPMEAPTAEETANTVGVIAEGTYALGEELLASALDAQQALLAEIDKAPSRPVLVPVLSLGRAQEVCAALADSGLRVGVFGLAAQITRLSTHRLPDNVTLDDRRPEQVRRSDYDILVASAGCLQGGPATVFYRQSSWGVPPVILTGYLFPGTPARRLAGQVPRVRFSAHSPANEWREYLTRFAPARTFLIHLPGWPLKLPLDNAVVPRTHAEYLVGAGA